MNWKRCPGEKGTLCGGEEADTERSGKEVGREQPQAPAAICTKPFAGGYLELAGKHLHELQSAAITDPLPNKITAERPHFLFS